CLVSYAGPLFFFFFQAEDGIRDSSVTGVQTCALPICTQRPLRLRGDISVAPDRVAIDSLKADIDGGSVDGRIALITKAAGAGSRDRKSVVEGKGVGTGGRGRR